MPHFKNEKHFTSSVKKAARQFGWLPYHTLRSKGSDPGFPDLVLVHRGRKLVIWAELKMPKGKLTEHQKTWREYLLDTGQEYYLWYPKDWDFILTLLQYGDKASREYEQAKFLEEHE